MRIHLFIFFKYSIILKENSRKIIYFREQSFYYEFKKTFEKNSRNKHMESGKENAKNNLYFTIINLGLVNFYII